MFGIKNHFSLMASSRKSRYFRFLGFKNFHNFSENCKFKLFFFKSM